MTRRGPRVAVVATHPIQYHAPWFRALVAEGVDLHVLFALLPDAGRQAVGFGTGFEWDVPILRGYPWSLLGQTRREPDLGKFLGLRSAGLGRALATLAPDAVVLTGWNALPLVQGLLAAIRLGVPTVVRGESNALRPRPPWREAGQRALLASFDAFVAIGKANRAFYERNGARPERIVDGGYFVDEEHFEELRGREMPRRAERRRRWGVPEGACCFLFVGKLQPKKRPLDFLAALERVARRSPAGAVHGLVVGSGELEAEARTAAAENGVPITFAGFLNQSEIGAAYAAGDVLVLPSDWGETWGLVVNEGMLFGLPAVVSDRVGCGPDLVTGGETGRIAPFGDANALADAMEGLVRDAETRKAMGAKARARSLGYSPRRGARATLEAVRIAMGGA